MDQVVASQDDASRMPVVKAVDAGAPFRWLANGKPLPDLTRRRSNEWTPEGQGFSTLTVIDADGRASSVRIFVQ